MRESMVAAVTATRRMAVALIGDGGAPEEEGVEQDCRRRGLAAAVDIAETEHFEIML